MCIDLLKDCTIIEYPELMIIHSNDFEEFEKKFKK